MCYNRTWNKLYEKTITLENNLTGFEFSVFFLLFLLNTSKYTVKNQIEFIIYLKQKYHHHLKGIRSLISELNYSIFTKEFLKREDLVLLYRKKKI